MKIRSKYAYMVFKITDDKKQIVIDCTGEKGASFEDFTGKLPEGGCRYAVLDVEINTKSGATANKLIFVAWYAAAHASNVGPKTPVQAQSTTSDASLHSPSPPGWNLPPSPAPPPRPAQPPGRGERRRDRALSRLDRWQARSPLDAPRPRLGIP